MLLVAGSTVDRNRADLSGLFQQELIPTAMEVKRGRLLVHMERWRDYWRPALPFFSPDARLVQRLNRLKRTWEQLLAAPLERGAKRRFAWRYFGLLHHALELARSERGRPGALAAIERIVAFESFVCEAAGVPGTCGGMVSSRHPAWALAEVGSSTPLPSPRRVPVIRPLKGHASGYYHYRQVALDRAGGARLLLYPAIEPSCRGDSFAPIERVLRLCGSATDPYATERAALISKRLSDALLRQLAAERGAVSILDLGAGTGHVAARLLKKAAVHCDAIHFVDVRAPIAGRGFGVGGTARGVETIEWTVADYRALLDRADWIIKAGPFELVLMCRLLDNLSTFELTSVDVPVTGQLPHELSERSADIGTSRTAVPGTRAKIAGGVTFLQASLTDYFAAMKIVITGNVDAVPATGTVLPVRRFNPASLTTRDGRSVLGRLAEASKAILIDDMDLTATDLRQHCERFGLSDLAIVQLGEDGFRTESASFVACRRHLASTYAVSGQRVW